MPENVNLHLQHIFTKGLAQFHINYDDAVVLVPYESRRCWYAENQLQLQKILNPATDKNSLINAFTTFKARIVSCKFVITMIK